MSTISENPPTRAGQPHDRPSFADQKSAILDIRATDTAAVSEQWHVVADLLDEFVTEYDAHLADCTDEPPTELHRQLQEVMDGFDVLGSVARSNADVLDDLATEITLAQARVSTIWTEYLDERSQGNELSTRLIERRYAARSAREVWYPFDGAVEVAARRLRVVPNDSVELPAADGGRVVPFNRESRS